MKEMEGVVEEEEKREGWRGRSREEDERNEGEEE